MDELQRETERLKRENQELRNLLQQVSGQLRIAEETIKQLRQQLGQKSQNSNWPPSRDKSRQKPKPKSLRPKTDRKAGGQAGHEGHTLAFQPEPDVVEKHRPTHCHQCQLPLPRDVLADEVAKRQVLELPPLRFVTIEHQAETIICPCCGAATTGEFPTDVTNPVQYGSQVKRLAIYLRNEQFIPYERERQLLF